MASAGCPVPISCAVDGVRVESSGEFGVCGRLFICLCVLGPSAFRLWSHCPCSSQPFWQPHTAVWCGAHLEGGDGIPRDFARLERWQWVKLSTRQPHGEPRPWALLGDDVRSQPWCGLAVLDPAAPAQISSLYDLPAWQRAGAGGAAGRVCS